MINMLGAEAAVELDQFGLPSYKIEWGDADEGVFKRGYVSPLHNGVEFVLSGQEDNPVIFCIHIDLNLFKGSLPLNLSQETSIDELQATLGKTVKSGGGTTHPILGSIKPWYQFSIDDKNIATITYDGDKISKISLFDKNYMMED